MSFDVNWRDFLAGWAGGVLGVFCGHPMDTTKVRQQVLNVSSPLRCLVATVRYEGLTAPFKGLSFPLITSGIINSVFFGSYHNCLRQLSTIAVKPDAIESNSPRSSIASSFTLVGVSAALAGVCQLIVAVPVDLVKVRLQMTRAAARPACTIERETQPAGPVGCVRKLYSRGGVRGLYQGGLAQFLRDVPASAAYFVIYEWLMDWHRRSKRIDDIYAVLMAGGVAGALSWTIIMPLDAVKSRIQAQDASRPRYAGVIDCVRQIVSQPGGVRSLMHGLSVTIVRGFVVNAATFFGYEYTKMLI